MRLATEALRGRVERYVFVSSISAYADFSTPASEDSPLARLENPESESIEDYGPLKAECERLVQEAFGERALVVRPGLIAGQREEFRTGERIGLALFTALAPVLPRRLRVNPAAHIARELLHAALRPTPGTHVVASDRMI